MKNLKAKIFKKEKEALEKGACCDCGTKLEIEDGEIKDGALLIKRPWRRELAAIVGQNWKSKTEK